MVSKLSFGPRTRDKTLLIRMIIIQREILATAQCTLRMLFIYKKQLIDCGPLVTMHFVIRDS